MPYYAIPSTEKSAMPQAPLEEFEDVGFAFNKPILDLLRSMGHRGYINSDSGILSKMAWGVEELSVPERVGRAVMAGTDMIADTNDVGSIRTAYLQGLFTTERLDDAARRLTEEMFALGLFDNPYVDADRADHVVANPEFTDAAERAHRRSVVVMKNHAGTLPLGADRLTGRRSTSSSSRPTSGWRSSTDCAPPSRRPIQTSTSPPTTTTPTWPSCS